MEICSEIAMSFRKVNVELGAFPIRPELYFEESLFSYLMRVARENGYENMMSILRLAKATHLRMKFDLSFLSRLEYLCGRNISDLSEITYFHDSEYSAYRRGDVIIPSQLLSGWFPKICPICIEEKGRAEWLWDINSIYACVEHLVLLIDQCSSCKSPISWLRSQFNQCQCGAYFGLQKLKPAPKKTLWMTSLTLNCIGMKGTVDIPDDLLWIVNDENPLHLLVRLIILSNVGKRKGIAGIFQDQAAADECVKLLITWPNGMKKYFVDALSQQSSASSRPYPNLYGLDSTFCRIVSWWLLEAPQQATKDVFDVIMAVRSMDESRNPRKSISLD